MGVVNINLISNVFEAIWALAGLIYAGGNFLYNLFWMPLDQFLLNFFDESSSFGSVLSDIVGKILGFIETGLDMPIDMPIFYYLFGVGVGFAVFYWLIIAFFKLLDLIVP